MSHELASHPNLEIIEGTAEDLIVEGDKVVGINNNIRAKSTVITTGTFLGGVCHIGKKRLQGGRFLRDDEGLEPPSNALSQTFQAFDFPLGRMKTGTPP